jgi:cytochrome b6-f complex iron-sulfur subunit
MKLLSLVTAFIAAGSATAFAPAKVASHSLVSTNMAAAEEYYIDEERRFLMNLILVGSAALTVGAIGVPYIAFFVPPGSGAGTGGIPAKDALGNDLFAQAYLESKPVGDRSLAQGLKGDATYLIVKDDKTLESYGLNAGKLCFCLYLVALLHFAFSTPFSPYLSTIS